MTIGTNGSSTNTSGNNSSSQAGNNSSGIGQIGTNSSSSGTTPGFDIVISIIGFLGISGLLMKRKNL